MDLQIAAEVEKLGKQLAAIVDRAVTFRHKRLVEENKKLAQEKQNLIQDNIQANNAFAQQFQYAQELLEQLKDKQQLIIERDRTIRHLKTELALAREGLEAHFDK